MKMINRREYYLTKIALVTPFREKYKPNGISPSTSKKNVFLSDKTEIKKVFERFDTNQDGKISGEELAALLKSLGSSTSAEEVELMISEMDSDKDGVVTLEEFAQFCSKKLEDDETGSRELHDAFELYDKDDNGLISASELQQVQTGLGEACSVRIVAR